MNPLINDKDRYIIISQRILSMLGVQNEKLNKLSTVYLWTKYVMHWYMGNCLLGRKVPDGFVETFQGVIDRLGKKDTITKDIKVSDITPTVFAKIVVAHVHILKEPMEDRLSEKEMTVIVSLLMERHMKLATIKRAQDELLHALRLSKHTTKGSEMVQKYKDLYLSSLKDLDMIIQ